MEASTARLKQEIDETREGLSETVAEIEERLNPSQLGGALREGMDDVEEKIRTIVGEQAAEAKAFVHTELREAKEALHTGMADAERMIRSGLHDAKETVKNELKEAVSNAKDSLRAATLGRVENFATQLGDSMNDVRESLFHTIASNPVPATMAGVGIVWLLTNRSRSAAMHARGGAGYGGDRIQRMGSHVGETVGQLGAAVGQASQQASSAVAQGLHGATETAGEILEGASGMATHLAHTTAKGVSGAAHTVTDGASALAGRAQAGAKRVERTFQRQLQARPLAIGAAAVAIGTMVGCALPRTDAEDELMGEARDNVLSRAGDAVHETATSMGVGGGQQQGTDAAQDRQASRGGPDQGGRNAADEQRGGPREHERTAGKHEPQGSQGKQSEQQRSRRDSEGKTATKS